MTEFRKMPEEMLVEILLRLLAKSLLRFKCVHKSWYNLIKNPSSVAKNLAKGPTNNSFPCLLLKRLIVKDTDTQNKEAVFSLLNISSGEDNGEHDIHYVIEDKTKGRFVELKMLESAWIVGHCDAIVCLVDPNKATVLLNPATMEFKLVTAEQHVPDKRINMGFGYDPKSKSLKIVDALPVEQERYGDEDIIFSDNIIFDPPIITVYSSGTDSLRQISTDSLESETTNFCVDTFQMCFRGFCYWTGPEQLKEYTSDEYDYDGGSIRQVIIKFDMADEVFENILVPYCLYEESFSWYNIHVMVWNGSISLLSLDGELVIRVDQRHWGCG